MKHSIPLEGKKYLVVSLSMFLLSVGLVFFTNPSHAQNSYAIIGPELEIYTGTGEQVEPYVAFDSINSRFLVVWVDSPSESSDYNIYGQLVSANGSLYGTPIPISTANDVRSYVFRGCGDIVAFDPGSQRYLVTWIEYHNGPWDVYGQLVNADGSLYGGNFLISPIDQEADTPTVSVDTTNNRFLVAWVGTPGAPYNIYGQMVNPDGSLHGSLIEITSYSDSYWTAYPQITFDSNSGRFLVIWGQQYDGNIYGRLIDAGGALYGDEITIDSYGIGSSYQAALSFDSENGRFLIVYNHETFTWGRLVNSNGTLSGPSFKISDYLNRSFPSIAFDSVDNKFLLVGNTGLGGGYAGLYGQFLNPDGSLYGPDFVILPGGLLPSSVVFGSEATGFMVVWPEEGAGQDVFGRFVKVGHGPEGDLDRDFDVDGSDLALLSANTSLVNIATFAQNYGVSDYQ